MTGVTLCFNFSSLEEANKFRSVLATTKYRQDKVAIAIGLFTEEEISRMVSNITAPIDGGFDLIIYFTDEEKKKKYTFTILPITENGSSE